MTRKKNNKQQLPPKSPPIPNPSPFYCGEQLDKEVWRSQMLMWLDNTYNSMNGDSYIVGLSFSSTALFFDTIERSFYDAYGRINLDFEIILRLFDDWKREKLNSMMSTLTSHL